MAMYSNSVVLKPGKTLEETANLGELFDLRAPGKYQVTVSHEVRLFDSGDDWKWVTIKSNAITISVLK